LGNSTPITDEPISRVWSKLGLMAEIAATFRNNPPERKTYNEALGMIRDVVSFDRAALYLYKRSKDHFERECAYNFEKTPHKTDQLFTSREFVSLLASHKKPINSADLKRTYKLPQAMDEPFLIIPLLVNNELIGMVNFIGGQGDAFLEKDIRLLCLIADQIAISIERSIYQKKLENQNAALTKAHQQLEQMHRQIVSEERLAAVKNLAASINHEINNPLSVITGNAEYILYSNRDLDPNIAKRLKTIENEAIRISDINRQLLKIQQLVTEPYLHNDESVQMINLKKSSAEVSNE
jgi:signal transduction histidine kinase